MYNLALLLRREASPKLCRGLWAYLPTGGIEPAADMLSDGYFE